MTAGLHENCVMCDPILSKHESGGQILAKNPNIKFHENPSSRSRTDMTKLIAPFAIFCERA